MNFSEKKKLPKEVILVSMHVTSLYTNISQVEGRNIVYAAFEVFREMLPSFQSPSQRKHRRNSFQFNEQRYLIIRGGVGGRVVTKTLHRNFCS